MLLRNRSCYCMDCLSGDADTCTQGEQVDSWKEVELPRESSSAVRQQTTEVNQLRGNNFVRIADLADRGSVVAIATDEDHTDDYNLLKVISSGVEEVESYFTDDYGLMFGPGSRILKRKFFLRENLIDLTHRLGEERLAAVHASTIRQVTS